MKVSRRDVFVLIRKWRKILGIGSEWKLDVSVMDEPCSDEGPGNLAQLARTRANTGYHTAEIEFFLAHIEDARELEEIVVHELTHVVTWDASEVVTAACGKKLEDMGLSITEGMVVKLSRALIRANKPQQKKRK